MVSSVPTKLFEVSDKMELLVSAARDSLFLNTSVGTTVSPGAFSRLPVTVSL